MTRRARVLTPLLAALAMGVAGVYTVYACEGANARWDNRSWALGAGVGGITADQDCPAAGSNIGVNAVPGGRR